MHLTTPLLAPALGDVYATLAPAVEALLRVVVGLALVLHGLRLTFGLFPDSGIDMHSVASLSKSLAHKGFRRPQLWARAVSLTQLIAGPMFTLGLFTRPAAVPIVAFLAVATRECWKKGGYFWNTCGIEYPLLWGVAALYFLVHGGGVYSLDHLLIGRAF
jgi:putative oxidoreductase